MKNLFFAALAALSLGVAVVPAYASITIAGDRGATVFQQTGTISVGGYPFAGRASEKGRSPPNPPRRAWLTAAFVVDAITQPGLGLCTSKMLLGAVELALLTELAADGPFSLGAVTERLKHADRDPQWVRL